VFTGQLNWPTTFGTAGQPLAQNEASKQDKSTTSFALAYASILEVSNEQDFEAEASGDGHNTDSSDWLLNLRDSRDVDAAFNQVASTECRQTWQAGNVGATLQNFFSDYRIRHSGPDFGDQPFPGTRHEIGTGLGTGGIANADGGLEPPANSAGSFDKSQLASWMDTHALSRSSHHCAMYCRLGMEAGGLNTEDRPRSGDAGDYGPFLLRHGAQEVPQRSYNPQVGDVVIFDKTVEHPSGHIEMYDGHRWVSDFMQHSFSPYRHAESTPPFTIYRLS
jgi:hypothetical protein